MVSPQGAEHVASAAAMFTADLIQSAVFGTLACLAGWAFKLIWSSIKDIQSEAASLSKELRTDYARKDDMRDALKDIKDMLSKIFDKLDAKADK